MQLPSIRRWGNWLGLAAASLLTSAQAQDPQQTHTGAAQPTQAARSDQYADVRVSELIGMDVRNNAQRRIGDVEDVLIDISTGEVRYAVLAYGGHMGIGETLFAYPTSAFAVNLQTGLLVLKLPDERLGQSEGFERGRWPASGNVAFWQRIENLFAGDRRFERPEASPARAPILIAIVPRLIVALTVLSWSRRLQAL